MDLSLLTVNQVDSFTTILQLSTLQKWFGAITAIFLQNQTDVGSSIDFLNSNGIAIQAIVAALSLVLSGLLWRVTQKQKDIEEAQQTPIVQVNRCKDHGKRDQIEVNISNHGQGAAKNLTGEATPFIKSRSFSPKRLEFDVQRKTVSDSDWIGVVGSGLGPGETDQIYLFEITLDIHGISSIVGETPPSFSTAMNELAEEDIEDMGLKLRVTYEDPLGKPGGEEILDYVFPVKKGMEIGDALEKGIDYKRYKENPERFEMDWKRFRMESG